MDEEVLTSSPRHAGEGRELGEVFTRTYRRLVMQVYAFVDDIAEATDLVQESFVRAAAAGNRFLSSEDHEAWLRATALDVHRQRSRKPRSIAKVHDRSQEPVDLAGIDRDVAIAALRSLPESTRQVVVLHDLADVPTLDVASIVGLPAESVTSHLQQGRESLVAALGSREGDPQGRRLLHEFRWRVDHLLPLPDLDELLWQGRRAQRGRVTAAVIVVVSMLAVAGVVRWSNTDDAADAPVSGDIADTSSLYGAMELPSEEASPSTPTNGDLVASMWSRGRAGWEGWIYVYADGRVIWQRRGPLPATGWVEQRLTTDGVELVRAEILSTGLFASDQATASDADRPPPGSELGYDWPSYGDVQVHDGDRFLLVSGQAGQAWMPEFDGLQQRLTELETWLPSRAWEDREVKQYVPARYAICPYRFPAPLDWSSILPLLPASAEEVLTGGRPWRWQSPTGDVTCFDVPISDARSVAEALDDAGVQQFIPAASLAYQFGAPDPEAGTLGIDIWPFLPDGVPATTGG